VLRCMQLLVEHPHFPASSTNAAAHLVASVGTAAVKAAVIVIAGITPRGPAAAHMLRRTTPAVALVDSALWCVLLSAQLVSIKAACVAGKYSGDAKNGGELLTCH
jgi:hypothetical protein